MTPAKDRATRHRIGLRVAVYTALGAAALLAGAALLCDLDRASATTFRVLPADTDSGLSLEIESTTSESLRNYTWWPLLRLTNHSERPVSSATFRLVILSQRGERVGHFSRTIRYWDEMTWRGLAPGASATLTIAWPLPFPHGQQVVVALEEWSTWSGRSAAPSRRRRPLAIEPVSQHEVAWRVPDLGRMLEKADAAVARSPCPPAWLSRFRPAPAAP